jgi:hypothetical protein
MCRLNKKYIAPSDRFVKTWLELSIAELADIHIAKSFAIFRSNAFGQLPGSIS